MKAVRIILICFIMLTALCSAAFSQYSHNQVVKTFNVADGLPQSFISGLVQDSTGFIWIATRDGLARYDGKEFKVFRHVPGDSTTLNNNTISSLHLGRRNRLWILYETGDIDILNTCTESLFHLTRMTVYKTVFSMLTFSQRIAEEAEDNTWMLSDSGIFICNTGKKTLHFYSNASLHLPSTIIGVSSYQDDMVLLTNSALLMMDRNRRILYQLPYPFGNLNAYRSTPGFKNIFSSISRKRKLVVCDDDKLVIYYPRTRSFVLVISPDKKTIGAQMTEDSAGQIYFDYGGDIGVLSSDNKLRVWARREGYPKFGLHSILADRSGVLWTGGNGTGIQCYDLRLSRFRAMEYKEGFTTDVLKNFLHIPEAQIQGSFSNHPNPYSFRWWCGKDGKLWFSVANGKILATPEICYYQNGCIVQLPWHFTNTVQSRHFAVGAIAQTSSGKLWGVDFFMRPVSFDTLTGTVSVYPPVAEVNANYTYTVSSLCMEGENKFWIGTELNGLFCYDKQTGKSIHYSYSESPGALPTDQLMNIVQDSSDSRILWIGSLGGGLISFNKTTGKCLAYTIKEGLPNNTVYAIIPFDKNTLWCSTNKGIFSFDTQQHIVLQSFTSEDGLPGDEFNRYHFLKLPMTVWCLVASTVIRYSIRLR